MAAFTQHRLRTVTHTAPGLLATWAGDRPMLVWGDGRVDSGSRSRTGPAVLDAVADPAGRGVLVLAEDATVRHVRPDLEVRTVCRIDAPWADRLVADRTSGLVAVATGRRVDLHALADGHRVGAITPPRAPTAMALRGSGPGRARLAIAWGGGVSVRETGSPDSTTTDLEAPGGHSAVTLSPDGRFVLASSAEPALIGWRLADGQGFRMGGYPGRPDGLVWTAQGELATTGGPAALVWPFDAADGPMGQSARVHRTRMGMVTALAVRRSRIGVGLSDGGVDLVDTGSGQVRHLAGPPPPQDLDFDPRRTTNRITSLAFAPDGRALAWCGEDGAAGVVPLQATATA